jgi:hypothetical protein
MINKCEGALVNSKVLFDYAQYPGQRDEFGRRLRLPYVIILKAVHLDYINYTIIFAQLFAQYEKHFLANGIWQMEFDKWNLTNGAQIQLVNEDFDIAQFNQI